MMNAAEPPDAALAAQGAQRLEWARMRMTMLAQIRAEFSARQPFAGKRIAVSLHLDPKTAVLLETLQAGGAEIVGTGNFGSTQDDIVATLRASGMNIIGRRDDSLAEHHANLGRIMDHEPHVLLDNGADLVALAVAGRGRSRIVGAAEETTSGGDRLRDEFAGKVPFPVIVINDSPLKQIGENLHAVGQSTVESFMRITGLMVSGRRILVIGYGWCGRGIARFFAALGARVAVAEIDPIKQLEAALDGHRVGAIGDFAGWCEVAIPATGRANVLPMEHIAAMPSGVILANTGHFPWEIDLDGLRSTATRTRIVDDSIESFTLADGREIFVLANGRMINLAGRSPRGNSIESMDLGFMLQALSLERVATRAGELISGAQPVPPDINERIAHMMLAAMGASL